MRSIGVDLHKRRFTSCFFDEGGFRVEEYSVSELERFQGELRKTDRLAVEATGNVRWFVDRVKGYVGEVVVVNPWQFRVISQSVRKTDEGDLAFFLSKGMDQDAG